MKRQNSIYAKLFDSPLFVAHLFCNDKKLLVTLACVLLTQYVFNVFRQSEVTLFDVCEFITSIHINYRIRYCIFQFSHFKI